MDWQTGASLLSILAGSLALGLAFMSWQYRALHGTKPLMGMALAITIWALLYTLELQAGSDLDRLVFWNRAKRVGMVFVEFWALLFAIEYTGRSLSRTRYSVIIFIPIVSLLIGIFNPYNLYWESVSVAYQGGLSYLQTQSGVWRYVHLIYQVLAMFAAAWIFIRHEGDTWQRILGSGSMILPIIVQILFLSTGFFVDLSPIAYSVSVTVLVFGVVQLGVFDVLPDAYSTVITNHPDGVLVLDTRNRILMMNPIFSKTIRKDIKDVIGLRVQDVFPAEALYIESTAGNLLEGIIEIKRRNRLVEMRIIALYEGARVKGRAFIFRDITARQEAENTVRESELRYRTLFDQARDAIIVEDKELHIVDANRAATRLLGYSYDNLLKMNMRQLQPTHDFRRDTPAGGRFEVQTVREDGVELDVELTLAPIPMGERVLYMSIMRDVTERKRTQRELAQRAEELSKLYEQVSLLEQYKTDMIRMAAHDLRHPISVTLGYLELLQDRNSGFTPTQQRYIEAIRNATHRANQMLSDILSLERIEEQAQNATRERFNFHRILGEIIAQYRDQALNKALHVQIDVAEDETPFEVIGDYTQMTEAIGNLLNNAIKYTPEGGKVFIRLREDANYLHFEVQDTGYGIPKEQQERLFRPFYRAKTDENSHIDGTGLGLHLVKNIVERHHGSILFYSEYGKGSLFGFRLPLIPEQSTSP